MTEPITHEEALLAAATGAPVGYRPVLHPAVPPTHVGRIRGMTGAALLLEGRRRFVPMSHCTLEVPVAEGTRTPAPITQYEKVLRL